MDTRSATDEIMIVGTWRPQVVVAAEADPDAPFVATLTFADGYRARVYLHDESAKNLGIVLRDPNAFRDLFVDPDLRTITWPNGYDYDPDSLRRLAIAQHPDDPAAVPPPLQ